jgi:D-alanyl-D-alanine carboxypeptidase
MLHIAPSGGAVPRTRRTRRATALAVVTLAVGLIAGACSSDGDPASGPATTQTATTRVATVDQTALDQLVEEVARSTMTPGLVVLLRSPEGTITSAYGTTEWDGTTPVTVDDHVRIGSNTKTMTGTVILQMVDEGKVRLDDPVSTYRSDVPNGQNITIAQLLDMRSGLFNYSETEQLNRTLDEDPTKAWTQQELLDMAFANPPYFPPGEGYHYSNTNTILLGLIAEQIDEKPLADVFQTRLFEPLGLDHTSFPATTDDSIPDPHPQGYMFGSNVETMQPLSAERQAAAAAGTFTPADVTDENPSWAWSAGAGISTIEDLATWAEALGSGRMLSAAGQQARLASVQPIDPGNASAPSYGYALARLGPLLGHTGELPGFNSFMGYDPDRQITVIAWSNLNAAPDAKMTAPAVALGRQLIALIYGTADGAGAPSAST